MSGSAATDTAQQATSCCIYKQMSCCPLDAESACSPVTRTLHLQPLLIALVEVSRDHVDVVHYVQVISIARSILQ